MSKRGCTQRDYETLAAFRFELRRFLQFSEVAAKQLGMTPTQHQSLLAIRAAPNSLLSVGELAEQLLIQPHTASELAERMVALGWIERHIAERDRRRVVLGLTATATEMLGEMSATHKQELVRIKDTLSDLLRRLG